MRNEMSMKRGVFAAIYGVLFLLPILVTGIVNFAIERELTWAYIAGGGILLAALVLGALILPKRNKIIKCLTVLTIFTLPYLGLIEYTINEFYNSHPVYWVQPIALPITLLSLGIPWIMVAARKIFKMNLGFCFSIGAVITAPATIAVNMIANQTDFQSNLTMSLPTVVTLLVIAFISFLLGLVLKQRPVR